MKDLQQGGNAPLATRQTSATLRWAPARVQGQELDVSAFLLAASGKVRNDKDFVFYGAMASPCGSLRLTVGRDEAKFDILTDRIPADIDKVAFVATLPKGTRFGSVQSLVFSVEGAGTYPVATVGMSEAAIIVAELYKRNGEWKMRAVGQGFTGGLGPLATQYGVNVDEPAPVPIPVPTPAPAPSRLSLNKITLEKVGQSATLSLEKSTGEITINLNWSQGRSGVDLDLGCYWRLRSGSQQLIDGLQFSRGRGGAARPGHQAGLFRRAAMGLAPG
jgi:tellurite resistance protein TerA